jgi:hypothetical protein
MAKQTFTTGQVLTAAQMTDLQATALGGGAPNTKTANYVLVAADAGTTVAMNAAGATTITVDTGLFSPGDTVFIQNIGAGLCTITAGTATVDTAGSLILPQYDAGILYFTSASAAIFYDYIQSGGGMTLLSTTTLSGASTTISGISGSYKNLYIEVDGFYPDSSNSIRLRINGLTTGVYRADGKGDQSSALATSTLGTFASDVDSVPGTQNFGYIYINNYASATNWKILDIYSVAKNNNGATYVTFFPSYLYVRETNAVTSITLFPVSGNWSAGTVRVYGVN